MNSKPYDLVFVSNHRLLAEAVGAALVEQRVIESYLHIRNGQEVHQIQSMSKQPNVVVLDERSYPDASSLYVSVQRITQAFPASRIVVLGDGDSVDRVTDCIISGASTFVLSCDCLNELAATVSALKQGNPRCSKVVVDEILRKIRELAITKHVEPSTDENALTKREINVLELVEQGMLNKEIARRLGIAVSTVKNHLHAIFEKYEVKERRQAVCRGISMGVLSCRSKEDVA